MEIYLYQDLDIQLPWSVKTKVFCLEELPEIQEDIQLQLILICLIQSSNNGLNWIHLDSTILHKEQLMPQPLLKLYKWLFMEELLEVALNLLSFYNLIGGGLVPDDLYLLDIRAGEDKA